MSTFNTTMRPTSFGIFDSDPAFQKDADNIVTFVLRRLGDNVLSIELTKKMIWSNFEEASREFNAIMVEYQALSNISNLLGSPTGSIDPVTNMSNINLTNTYVQQNLSFLSDLAAPYASAIGYGSSAQSISGSILLREGVQDYDLYTELLDSTGTAIYSTQPSGSITRLAVYEVFHHAPIQYVFNSNLASNFIGSGMPVESYVPDTKFYVLPLFEDVLRAGQLKDAAKIRRSHYTYKISGRNLRIYPIPKSIVPHLNDRVWLRVGFRQSPTPSLQSTLLVSGTMGSSTNAGSGQNFLDQTLFGANGPFNIPYGAVSYSSLNIWARNWIAQFCLAVSTEQLGNIRSKFKSLPIPGAEVTLNGSELVSQGREDKEKLLTTLRATLENLTYDKIAERESTKAENMVKQLGFIPVNPKYAISF